MKNNILAEDLEPVIDLLKTKDPRLTAGSKVAEFEEAWSKWQGIKYSVFVNSGSSANLLCMAWLKTQFPNGGKVVIPPFTWSSDISSIYWMGFEPLFADIKLETLAIDEDILEEVIEKNDDIVAVFLTHAQGINGLTKKILDLCESKKIHLIEDVCESHGALVDDSTKAGSKGILSCFSFYYAHHMSTIEGGMVCTNSWEIYQYLRMVRSHGMLRESTDSQYKKSIIEENNKLNPLFVFTEPGFNVRNNEIGAIIGLSQLNRLDSMISKRAENFEYFLSKLPIWAFTGFNLKGQSNYALNLILKEADDERFKKIEMALTNASIEYRKGSAGGGNQLRQPYIKKIMGQNAPEPSEMPKADHIHSFGLYMGNYPELEKESIDYIVKQIASC